VFAATRARTPLQGKTVVRTLRQGSEAYCILSSRDVQASLRWIEFHSNTAWLHFLRGFLLDPMSMRGLRDMLGDNGRFCDLSRLSDHQAIDELAWHLLHGHFRIIPCRLLRRGPVPLAGRDGAAEADEEDDRPSPPSSATSDTDNWIRFQVIDDGTEEPIPRVRLKVKLPSGEVRDLTTDADGTIEIKSLPAGTCDIQNMIDDAAFEVVRVA
jgi:hypothetical protein